LALDDPVVIILIAAVVILLFGASRIPQLARSLGQARREFDRGSKGDTTGVQPVAVSAASPAQDDPLVIAAQKEGIDTQGKTKEQIASELSWKLNRK
jgi:sec-independent protein translocase protein TatA